MKTVHFILNAHLDPIWLWPWQAGLDEALATCRSACDRLDAHPNAVFTRGEAWVYRAIERVDPDLFERVRAHIAAGRWEIVGGWWIQPDCNLPSRRGMEQQIERGRAYFESRFGPGAFPRIGYNVDSFGHAAALPEILRAHGQDRYIMMRPQEHEMPLPARIFRWRGHESGPEVTVFRIARGYEARHIEKQRIEAALTALPPGIHDTMCFIGVGDHGGGPTEEQIEWLSANEFAIDGVRLIFSSPSRFFDAIAPQTGSLPVVTGELQHHAVGCYSVHRPIKTAIQRAERLLEQAETMVAPGSPNEARLRTGWERVCFAHFHDTMGGTCLPSAYQQPLDQVASAAADADEILQEELRRKLRALPEDPLQRIVLWNPSPTHFSGCAEHEPWVEWQRWQDEWSLIDELGAPVAFQKLHSEAMMHGLNRLLIPVEIPAGGLRVFRIVTAGSIPQIPGSGVLAATGAEAVVTSAPLHTLMLATPATGGTGITAGGPIPLPELRLYEDATDTWSHQVDRYPEAPAVSPQWNAPAAIDKGPLMSSQIQTGKIGDSPLVAEWRFYSEQPFVELDLTVHWREMRKILKLVLPFAADKSFPRRIDSLMGGVIERENNGRELPLHDWTLLPQPDHRGSVGVVCPDVFAADAAPDRLRLTLLRSPYLAHHDPFIAGAHPRGIIADQGVHRFRFRLLAGAAATPAKLQAHANALRFPPLVADLTRGMPPLR